jgi:hypothetical protein
MRYAARTVAPPAPRGNRETTMRLQPRHEAGIRPHSAIRTSVMTEYDTDNDGALDLLKMDTSHDGTVDYRAVNHNTGHTVPTTAPDPPTRAHRRVFDGGQTRCATGTAGGAC